MNVITDLDAISAGQNLTRKLSDQARTLRYEALSAEARELARQCVLDYLACTIAGASEPLTKIMLAEMAEQGGAGEATVVGHAARLPVLSAALVNGSAAHALDYDDVNLAMPGHPSVALLPALLAMAEANGASGAAVLTAFVAGYELQCRVGRVIAPGHYDGLGFHATATVGSFGAAASCAHLLGLDAARSATALGIAGTQAAGLKSMFGTMCKPLHAGKAAYHGLLAARLAKRDFDSRMDVLECAQGFARTHSPDFHPARAFETPTGGYHLRNNLFKYHAACYLTHGPIEAARVLRLNHNLTPDRVGVIRLRVDGATDRVCNIAAPTTGLETKFSLRMTTAMALAGVETGRLDSYSEANAADPVLNGLRDKVAIEFQSGWPHTKAEMEIETTDGARMSATYDAGVPAEDVMEQGRRLEQKFHALVDPILGAARARDIVALVQRFDSLADVRALALACAAP
ncbi:MAG: MmgE/PrpD family protein [Acetobacteraceae bacterium]|nr:MmgE/PrpD family protein [Acetobacteraceae bacterium]